MADVTVANTAPALVGRTLACTDANGVITATWSFATPLALQGGAPGFQIWRQSVSGSGNLAVIADGTGGGFSMNNIGSVGFTGDIGSAGNIIEKGRTTPMGHWIDVPFNAANFSATGGTWTVTGHQRFSYMLVGKTAWIQLWIDGSTVAGAPSSLNVVMPFTIVVGQSGPILYYVLPNTGWGVYLQQAEDQVVRLYRDLGGAPFAATAGAAVRVALAVQIL